MTTVRQLAAAAGVPEARVRYAVKRLGLTRFGRGVGGGKGRGPGHGESGLAFTPAECDRIRAFMAGDRPRQCRLPTRAGPWRSESSLPEFAPVPLGGSGIEVPAHAVAELMRRREKFHAAGCVCGSA